MNKIVHIVDKYVILRVKTYAWRHQGEFSGQEDHRWGGGWPDLQPSFDIEDHQKDDDHDQVRCCTCYFPEM